MKPLCFLLLFCLSASAVQAQHTACTPGNTDASLNIGNVGARIFNNGALIWKGSPAMYEVPIGSGKKALWSANVWVTGLVDGEIRLAGNRFGNGFGPGPLTNEGLPLEDCEQYDLFGEITRNDIESFVNGGDISHNLQNWPWQLGAPVIDGDDVKDNYNLEGGDLPELMGDQRFWWVMNDKSRDERFSDSPPIGLEVQGSAFAFNDHLLDDFTFYNYQLVNKSKKPLDDAYFSFWVESGLGYWYDDYAGSDSLLHLGYFYNSDNFDEQFEGYGAAPPAIGFTFLDTPLATQNGRDDDRDGLIDEPGEQIGAAAAIIHNDNSRGFNGIPLNDETYFNYARGRWQDETRMFEGFLGHESGFPANFPRKPTNFIYPGDPTTGAFWSELNHDDANSPHMPSFRFFILSSGPFHLAPGDTANLSLAIVWSRGSDNLDSVRRLKSHTRALHQVANTLLSPTQIAYPPEPEIQYGLGFDQNFPNPFTESTTLRYSLPQTMQVRLAVYDMLGREVALLVDAQQEAGIYTAEFDAGNLPAGIYLARIELDFLQFTKRMVLIR